MKYVKTKSLAWWSGFLPLIAGVIVAASETIVPGLADVAGFINRLSGDIPPAALILAGTGLIGLRGAV